MKTYLKQATPAEREALAKAVSSSVGYLYLIGGAHRRPGSELCKALVRAEPKLTLHELRPDIWPAPEQRRRITDGSPAQAPTRPFRSPPNRKNVAEVNKARPRIDDAIRQRRASRKK